jgi:6-phosphogluconolactonase (cycloisomerase 2 family)
VFSIDTNTGRLFLVQNQQTQNAFGTPLTYFPVGCGAIDFHLLASYLYTAENSDPTNPSIPGQVIYAYSVNPSNGQLTQVAGGSQPVPGATNIGVLGTSASGTYLYVLDNGTNQIFTFTNNGGNGLLSAISTGAVTNVPNTAGMTALTTDSSNKYLYVTNTQSTALGSSASVIAAFTITSGTGTLTPFGVNQNNAPVFGVGSNPVCIFEDPSHQYVYTANAGTSDITGAKLFPNTGTLTTLSKGSTFKTVGTPTWCLYSSNTD